MKNIALIASLALIGCGGTVQITTRAPAVGPSSALKEGKIARVEVQLAAELAAIDDKVEIIDEYKVREVLARGIEDCLKQAGYVDVGSNILVRVTMTNFRLKDAMWAGPAMGPDIFWAKVELVTDAGVAKSYEVQTFDNSGTWSESTRLSAMLSAVAQSVVNQL